MSSTNVAVVLTGFGRFHGVDDNPTSQMVPRLKELLAKMPGVELAASEVLEVSAIECLRFFKRNQSSKSAVFLHLGVAASRTEICLEQCAYNNADFRCPDERGWNPLALQIEGEEALTKCRRSPLPLEAMCVTLKKRFGDTVRTSDDAGRFLCNYIYYQSLMRGFAALFVHVPPFDVIPMERQMEVLVALVEQLRDAPK